MLTDWSEIKISGKETYPEQGLLHGYSGMKWVSSRILFVHSGSKAAANNDLLAAILWQLHELQWNSCLAQLHLRGRG